jgi:hypothetical protein
LQWDLLMQSPRLWLAWWHLLLLLLLLVLLFLLLLLLLLLSLLFEVVLIVQLPGKVLSVSQAQALLQLMWPVLHLRVQRLV